MSTPSPQPTGHNGAVTITKSFRDSSRRSAAIGGAVVTVLLVLMFLVEGLGLWRPLGQSWTWAIAAVATLLWTVWFASHTRYHVVADDQGLTRRQGKQRIQVAWSDITELVALPTKVGHLAVLSTQAPLDRTPGEMSLIRAYRLPQSGLVLHDDEQLRELIVERSGRRVRAVREVVGP